MSLRIRLEAAWKAFCNAKQLPMYAVIYDSGEGLPADQDPIESYYERFETPAEAYEMFESAFPKEERERIRVVEETERLVMILGPIDSYAGKLT